MDLQLKDKVAIVTGSTRGLGFSAAKALLAEGCNVTICARGEERIAQAVAELRELPGGTERILAIQADLSTDKGVADVVSRTVETFGGLDILVNNVGLGRGTTIVDTTDAEWREAIDQVLRNDGRNIVLDLIALRLADGHELLRTQALVGQVGVIGDDDVRRRAAGGFVDEAGAAADIGKDADAAKADRFDLRDAEVAALSLSTPNTFRINCA